MNEIFRRQLEGDDSFLLSRYRTTKGTGPAPFGSASVVTKKQELELNQPLIITFVVPNLDGYRGHLLHDRGVKCSLC